MAPGNYAPLLAFALSFPLLGVNEAYLSIPLKIFPGKYNVSSAAALPAVRLVALAPDGKGLSLATDPSGQVNFVDMVGNLQGDSGRGYYIEMLIGTPGQQLNILVDTGSSNFAVAAASHPFITHFFNTALSTSFSSAGQTVAVRYTQGNWMGELAVDIVSIPRGLNGTITVNLAAILSSEGFFLPGINWQGILGLAYPMLARIMGGAEPTLYRGSIWYTPIVEEWYYQVEVLKLEVGDQNLDLDCREYNMDKAIVDSGTTLLRLPVNVFSAVVDAITRSSLIQDFSSGFWDGTKLACWMRGDTPWRFFPKLSIYLRDTNTSESFRITILPQLYIQPITDVDGTLDCYRFGVSSSTNGLVIGATVMEGFYVVFDRAQHRLGFALSNCAVSGGAPLSEVAGPFSAADVATDCSGRALKEPLIWVISYGLMAVCAIILIILLLLLVLPCRQRSYSGEITDESSLVRHRIK
ncbi:beta-secretase 2 isoform X2 [Dunckerocampus dactyliophorus]|uniref:beta-secretase 2 isoform X2 n=1 Tax=Dunckerocampus dactyliophorus TaxID=161453 RepID=UPI00240497BC|nr:beta-secretase 2 isoform X2 [Dunckerocampus dactyliophorus]